MPDEPVTSPDAANSEGNARSHRANNKYYDTQRPRNNISGLEELTLMKGSRTPALDLRKAKEALQNKIIHDGKDGYQAAMLLDEAQSQMASSVGLFQQSTSPTPPAPIDIASWARGT